MGPYLLVDLLGLDTVLHVAEHLAESYGDERFHVPKGMQKLVAAGMLGAKTGGGASTAQGEPNVEGEASPTSRSWSSCWPSRPLWRPAWCSKRASPRTATSTSG